MERRIASAARHVRAALACVMCIAGCQPVASVGTLREAGTRCDPLANDCGLSMACTLRGDPSMDACRIAGTIAIGASCTMLDACVGGAQCAVTTPSGTSLAPADLVTGARCLAVCARDAPACASGEHCADISDGAAGTRLDFGLCTR